MSKLRLFWAPIRIVLLRNPSYYTIDKGSVPSSEFTMLKLNANQLYQVIDVFLYSGFLVLGCYFIKEGKVWEKFQQKRTNFAEFSENVTELPTVLTLIAYSEPTDPLSGQGYTMWYKAFKGTNFTQLVEGENWIYHNDGDTRLQMEKIVLSREKKVPAEYYRLTPLNFSPGMPTSFILRYALDNSTTGQIPILKVGISMAANNNSECGDGNSYDGDIKAVYAKPGEYRKMYIKPHKYVFKSEVCRKLPYYELLLSNVSELMKKECDSPCRPTDFIICNNNTAHKQV